MARYRDRGNTNAPRTCLWCGAQLGQYFTSGGSERIELACGGFAHKQLPAVPSGTYGRYGDNHFCGLRCGYLFGLAMAEGGRRLIPK